MSENPYQPPQIVDIFSPEEDTALAIRQAHINHEASVRSIGFLYYLGAIALTIATLGSLIELVGILADHADVRAMANVSIPLGIFGVLAIIQWVTARGIRTLRPRGRIMGVILSAIGLLAFPIGTLINGYILYLLLAKKGKTVFSPGYKEIITATPQVKCKTSRTVWIVLGILLVVVAGILLFAFFMPASSPPAPQGQP